MFVGYVAEILSSVPRGLYQTLFHIPRVSADGASSALVATGSLERVMHPFPLAVESILGRVLAIT